MLRFPRDQLHIGIEPDRIALVRQRGVLRRRIVADAILPLDIATAEGLEIFGRVLKEECWRGCQAHVVLADRLLRYLIVERPDGARNAAELELAARLRFEDRFSESAEDWELRIDLHPLTTNDLVVACPKSLLANISTQCRSAHTPVGTITPFAIAEWNRHPRLTRRPANWFVVVGRETLWAARRSSAAWQTAHQHRWQGNLTAAISQVLQREALRFDIKDEKSAPVIVVGHLPTTLKTTPTFTLPAAEIWPGQSATWSNNYRLALAPVWPRCN